LKNSGKIGKLQEMYTEIKKPDGLKKLPTGRMTH
jgi:hypothetical protein